MIVEWWAERTVADINKSNCEAYVEWRIKQPRRRAKTAAALAKPISTDTARRELEDMRAAINAYHREHTLKALPVVTMPAKQPGRTEWLTRHQASRLLGATLGFVWDAERAGWKRDERGWLFRRGRMIRVRRAHITRFILLGLYSARREATIRRTQWVANTVAPWMDIDRIVYHGRGRDEQETKKRRGPQKIAHRLLPHLRRWHRLDAALSKRLKDRGAERSEVRHIVHRPDGRPLNGKIKTGWASVLADAGLDDEFVRHALRHTAATWMMQARTDPWQASGFLAMDLKTLLDTYGHHHPDFQEEAAGAFGGRQAEAKPRSGARR